MRRSTTTALPGELWKFCFARGGSSHAEFIAQTRRREIPTVICRHGCHAAAPDYEGACRHLVKDRMDITGARWDLEGAEAILKLRALISDGDFERYWRYHLRKEHERVHHARYRESYALAA